MTAQKSITVNVDEMLQQLSTTYAAAVSDLESESEALKGEAQGILKAADELRLLLPARAREAQRLADTLLLCGKPEEAEAKRAEQAQAERAPAEMEARRATIDERLGVIEGEKRAIARRVFHKWFDGLRGTLVAEQQTLCEALDNAWDGVIAFARETGTAASQPPLLTSGLRYDLTARERGAEKVLFERLFFWFGPGRAA